MKKILFCFLFLLAGWPMAGLKAQTAAENQVRYLNAQELLKQQKPALAMAEFLPLTNLTQPNPFQASAHYLYSVAANKAGKNQEATIMLQRLFQNFPEWENLEEAYYLSAKNNFEQYDYLKALAALQKCQSDYIKADALNMERTFLTTITDKNQLKSLQQQFPEDAVLGKILADKLMAGWYAAEDKPVLDMLVRKFNLNPAVYNTAALAANRKKDQYNIAVLLPFSFDNIAQARKNQFVTDLYAGMKIAQDSLAANNVKINLYTYNAPADTALVKQTLALPELKTMDLVIGPIYKATNRIASEFASRHKINVINPLSEDLDVVKNNPNLFLFESSIETRARKAADFAYDTFEPKTAAIIFENTKDDTTFARVYRQQFLARGGKVLLYKKINTKKNPNVMAVYAGLDLKTYGHLLVASKNLPAAVATISQLESQNPVLPVITYKEWLEIPQLSLQQLDELELYFVSPNYLDLTASGVSAFRKKYIGLQNIPASSYSFLGFEMLYYYGNLLAQYGLQFQNALPNIGPVSGALLSGIYYGNAHDNQYVPILKLENKQLNIINPISR